MVSLLSSKMAGSAMEGSQQAMQGTTLTLEVESIHENHEAVDRADDAAVGQLSPNLGRSIATGITIAISLISIGFALALRVH
jgi:hypothetical protein